MMSECVCVMGVCLGERERERFKKKTEGLRERAEESV